MTATYLEIPPVFNIPQAAVLAVVDRHSTARIARKTDLAAGTVNGSAAHALIRCGVLEPLRIDGAIYVRRADHYAPED